MSELKPETWLFQHEDTGAIHYIDNWQVENGFEENNLRLQKIAPMYRISKNYTLVPNELIDQAASDNMNRSVNWRQNVISCFNVIKAARYE